MTDHYATLGVAKNASQDEIKKAFRKLASQHHPDKGGDTAKFQEIQAAYDVLGDEAKRQQYDNPAPQFGGFGGQGAQFNMNDIFAQMFGGGMNNPFGQHPRRNHVRMSLWVTLNDVARGGSRPVSLGTPQGNNTVEIEIPKGIEDGDNVQYGGIAPGGQDLVIQFRVQNHPKYRREGLNIYMEHTVSVWDMILGADTQIVDVLNNTLVISVPEKTQPNTTLRLRGKGLENRQGLKGDLMVKIIPEIPKTIAPEIVAAIRQYR